MSCSHCKQSGHNIRTCRLLEIRRSMAVRTIAERWRTYVWYQPHIPGHYSGSVYSPPSPLQENDPPCCPICFDKIASDSSKTLCGHLFHTACLIRSSQENEKCPVCRTEIVQPSDKKFTQTDLLNAESDGRRQGFFDFERVYAEQAFDYRNTIAFQGNTINEMESEIKQLKRTIASIQNEFKEKLQNIKILCQPETS